MIDLSLAGLLGAIFGTVIAGLAYVPLIAWVERSVRSSPEARERSILEREMPIVRRAVLAVDIFVFAGMGYWMGAQIGG
jgi:hypothetical protein